jgi:hypothetical protein
MFLSHDIFFSSYFNYKFRYHFTGILYGFKTITAHYVEARIIW